MGNHTSTSFLVVKPTVNHTKLMEEYLQLIQLLRDKGVVILELIMPIELESNKYLNSGHWISFHDKGVVAVYPMSTIERQRERTDVVFDLLGENGFKINDVLDFTEAENEGYFLEGSGSIVLDRIHNVAYASLSTKCDEELFIEFCEEFEFAPIVFSSEFSDSSEVVHTSSVLAISEDFVMVASGLIKDKKERKFVTSQLKKTGRKLIYISENQVLNYVADIKQVKNKSGESFVLLSKLVLASLTVDQVNTLSEYGELIISDFSETEKFGKHSVGVVLNDLF